MEMESINRDSHIISVYSLHYVIRRAKLIDGAVRSTAEFQGNPDVRAYLVRQIAKSCNCLFLNLGHTLILHVELRNRDQHLHTDRVAHLDNEVRLLVDLFHTGLIPLVEIDQGIIRPWFQMMVLKPVCQFLQRMLFQIVLHAVEPDLNIIKTILLTCFQVSHEGLSLTLQCCCFIKS